MSWMMSGMHVYMCDLALSACDKDKLNKAVTELEADWSLYVINIPYSEYLCAFSC